MRTRTTLAAAALLAIGALFGWLASNGLPPEVQTQDKTPVAGTPSKFERDKLRKIDPGTITTLLARDAAITGEMKEMYPGPDYKRFWMYDWKTADDRFEWAIEVPKEDDYSVAMILKDESRSGDPCEIELSAGKSKLTHVMTRQRYWERQVLAGALRLPAGRSTLAVRALKIPAKGKLALHSVELVRPDVKKALDESARSLRADTSWMVQAKYGVMFHWTARTKPRSGPAKPYADAVKDFDVEAFAAMVKRTGAGFVVLTTSWADYYFPAPIQAIDEILPGRTASRDLVADLADALGKHGIKLMLYYHPGHDDEPWWSKTGFHEEDKTGYFEKWCRVISAVGERYGAKLAGWWFDDGFMCYYAYNAPWEKMTRAAKAGNPARVVGYNAWVCPKATDFQDYSCGEGNFNDFLGKEFLPKGGTGRFAGGPQEGLQAAITWMLEPGNWCHLDPDKEISPPLYTKERLTSLMRGCVARRIVPMLNLEAYQDGTTSPATVELLEAVGEALRNMKEAPEQIQDDVATSIQPRKTDIALESVDGKREGYLTYVENVDCVTCWRNAKDKLKWSFTAPEGGKYSVIATVSHGQGPSEYVVTIGRPDGGPAGDQKLTGKIAGIGAEPSWSDYVDEVLGVVELAKGQSYEAAVKVSVMPKKGTPLNVRRILLRPVK